MVGIFLSQRFFNNKPFSWFLPALSALRPTLSLSFHADSIQFAIHYFCALRYAPCALR
jgi:hypothetical protein